MKGTKALLSIFTVTLILLSVITQTSAESVQKVMEWDKYKYYFNETGITIKRYTSRDEGELIIPATIDGYTVTELDNVAFVMNSFSSVIIPDTVTKIGSSCFAVNHSLASVTLPDGLEEIGPGNPFKSCESLVTISISRENESFATIQGVLFEKKSKTLITYPLGIKSSLYEIPNGIIAIGDYAFYKCLSLKRIEIPPSIEVIGEGAFSGCELLESILIPDNVAEIGDMAFSACVSLSDVVVSEGNTRFSAVNHGLVDSASKRFVSLPIAANLKSYTVPDGIETIAPEAFQSNKKIETIILPDSVTEIGDKAFRGCESLREITLPEGVKGIGEGAFSSCTSLEQLRIPATIENIGKNCFDKCENLTLLVEEESYAERYAIENGLKFTVYAEEDTSWLN